MSTYAGNPALATAVKDRVTSTFQQAITLFKHGRSEEVAAGCTLILQMDPLFDPAKKLLEKVRNPASPIDVESLLGAGANDQIDEAREALAARDFQRVVNITTEILTNDLMNDEARTLGDEAREKMEASPFVEQFAKKCEQHLAAGNTAAAAGDLEKARSLDPTHPAVGRIQQMIAARQAAPAAAAPASYASGAQPSFVVENPSSRPTGRPATQATDFGFTFEEDKADAAPAPKAPEPDLSKKSTFSNFSFDAPSTSGFSFDAPTTGAFSFDSGASQSGAFTQPAAAKAPASGEFDFSTASVETSDDDEKKIGQYLSDGDRAFDSGDYQQAIDLWSRIFLIDVTNEQASERIEKAKAKRRELEQKVEPMLSSAVQAYERKDYDTARVKLNEVLRSDPKNPSALEYLARLPEGATTRPGSTPPPAAEVTTIPLAPSATVPDIFADDALSGSYETPLTPPPPVKPGAEKKSAARAAVAKPSRGLPLIPIVAAIALIVVAAGGWFVWSRFSKPSFDPKATEAVFKQVDILAKQGQYEQAIGLLQDVKPEDPLHDRAVLMIADLQHKRSQGAQTIDGRPAGAFYQEQIAAGRSAFDMHDYDGAKRALEQAMRVKALPADVRTIYDSASQQVAKLDGAKSLFRSRQYQDALGNLEQLMQQDPQNPNIRRMIIDAHFNLGATALQEERLDEAIKQFDEVLKLDPNDELAKRSRDLSVRYNGQPKDMLFKIYVKYLPLRQVG